MRATLIVLALTLTAPVAAQQNPLGGGGGGNPLAKTPPWAGTYSDGNVSLTLAAGSGAGAIEGKLAVGGSDYPVSGTHTNGTSFQGEFTVDGNAFAFTATRQGNTITLVSDGNTYQLTRAGAPANP